VDRRRGVVIASTPDVKIVIDHVTGSRRGQRQELASGKKVRFGRHPDCEVSFDATRDIDASSRHAELRPPAEGVEQWMLVDVGSSNGTYANGKRVTELPVVPGTPVMVEFGPAGPALRLFIGSDEQVVQLGVPPVPALRSRRGLVLAVALALLVAAGVVVAMLLM
jgi:hypothetical protein